MRLRDSPPRFDDQTDIEAARMVAQYDDIVKWLKQTCTDPAEYGRNLSLLHNLDKPNLERMHRRLMHISTKRRALL
jgi:hypothetical protein